MRSYLYRLVTSKVVRAILLAYNATCTHAKGSPCWSNLFVSFTAAWCQYTIWVSCEFPTAQQQCSSCSVRVVGRPFVFALFFACFVVSCASMLRAVSITVALDANPNACSDLVMPTVKARFGYALFQKSTSNLSSDLVLVYFSRTDYQLASCLHNLCIQCQDDEVE